MNVIDNYINNREDEALKIIGLIKDISINNKELIDRIKALGLKSATTECLERISKFQLCYIDFSLILGRVNYELLMMIINKMIINRVLIKSIVKTYGKFDQYVVNTGRVQYLIINNAFDNLLFGYNFILKKYRRSVVAIENIDKEDKPSIGTGFISSVKGELFIVTNSHVLEKHKKITIYSSDKEPINYEIIHENKDIDIAIIKVLGEFKCNPFYFYGEVDILSEIITMGFPNIPMARDCYQVVHKGEINALIQDLSGNENILFSARTSSGNSGSPLINIYGSIVGMVSRELFNKDALVERGVMPYYAAIPSNIILKVIEEAKAKFE